MAADAHRSIRIGAVGVEGQEFTVLKVAMNLLAAHGIDAQLSDGEGADNYIVVVDADNEAGKNYLSRAGSQFLLVLASQEIPPTTGLVQFEPKPIRVQAITNSLLTLCSKLPESSVQPAAAEAKAEAKPVIKNFDKLKIGDARNLFELMLAARQQQQAVHIEGAAIGEFVMAPSSKVVGLKGDRKLIITNPSLPVSELSFRELSDVEAASALGGLDTVEIGTLMWNMAIIGRQVDLPPGHDTHTPVKLRAWPNFTRLGVGSNHINLSALLTRQAMSLEQLSRAAGVALDTLVAFYNGTLAIGLLTVVEHTAIGEGQHSYRPTEKRRGLFAKIANRLALMKGE